MKPLLWIVAVFAILQTVSKATALTNEQFFNLVKGYATDIEEYDIDEDDSDAVEANDVITLPGGPDDDVDFGYLLSSMGLDLNLTQDVSGKMPSSLSWWHHHHHGHHGHHQKTFHCSCQHDKCECCLTHTFRVNLIFKKFHFRLHACLTAAYLRTNIGVELTFSINSHRLFHKEISLKNPPPLCFGVPGLRTFARVCVGLYNINIKTKHICARITGVLDLKIHKFRVHLKLGCFRIPIMDQDAFLLMMNDPDFLKIQPIDDLESSDVTPRDIVDIMRGLQKMSSDGMEFYEVSE